MKRVILVGGGAKSAALRAVLPDTFGMPVAIPEVREYVALGAARQAAWVATGKLPRWQRRIEAVLEPSSDPGAAAYRERYVALRSELMRRSG